MTTGRINQVAPSHFKGHSGRSLNESQPEHTPSSQRDVKISCKTFMPCTSCIPRRKHTQHAKDMANKWADLPSHNAPRPLRSFQPRPKQQENEQSLTHPLGNASKGLHAPHRGPPRSPPGQQQRWTSIARSPAAASMQRGNGRK